MYLFLNTSQTTSPDTPLIKSEGEVLLFLIFLTHCQKCFFPQDLSLSFNPSLKYIKFFSPYMQLNLMESYLRHIVSRTISAKLVLQMNWLLILCHKCNIQLKFVSISKPFGGLENLTIVHYLKFLNMLCNFLLILPSCWY